MSLGTIAQTRRLRATRERDDFYRTPSAATEALLAVERLPRRVWEPACGDGAMARVLEAAGHEVVSTDLIDRGFGTPGVDFLMEQRALAPCIVTNPPFKLADDFVAHALRLGVRDIALFQRLTFLEGRARHAALWSQTPPARVWVFARRLTLWRGDDPNPQDKGGAIAWAWFVWDGAHSGSPKLGWLP